MPKIAFEDIDTLIVDRYGKEIREYNKFCVNSIEKKASLLDWC